MDLDFKRVLHKWLAFKLVKVFSHYTSFGNGEAIYNGKFLHVLEKNHECILWDYISEWSRLPLKEIQSNGRQKTYLLTENKRRSHRVRPYLLNVHLSLRSPTSTSQDKEMQWGNMENQIGRWQSQYKDALSSLLLLKMTDTSGEAQRLCP